MPDGQGQVGDLRPGLGRAHRGAARAVFAACTATPSGGVINVDHRGRAGGADGWRSACYGGSYDTWRAALKFGGQWGALNGIGDLSRFEHRRLPRPQRRGARPAERQGAASTSAPRRGAHAGGEQPAPARHAGPARPDARAGGAEPAAGDAAGDPVQHAQDDRARPGRRDAGPRTVRRPRGCRPSAWAGSRFVEQFLAIPLATQTPATHSGGVVNLDRTLRRAARCACSTTCSWAAGRCASRPASSTSAWPSTGGLRQQQRRRRARCGATRTTSVSSTDLFAQARVEIRRALVGARWACARARVAFESDRPLHRAPGNPDDSGAKTTARPRRWRASSSASSRTTSLYANCGRGFETPTFVELAYQNPPASGLNFALEASRSRHVEVGVKAIRAGACAAECGAVRHRHQRRDRRRPVERRAHHLQERRAHPAPRARARRRDCCRGAVRGARRLYLPERRRSSDATVRHAAWPVPPATCCLACRRPSSTRELRWRHAPTGFRVAARAAVPRPAWR